MRSLRNIFLLIPAFIYGVSCQVIEEIQYDENVKILVSINDEYQTRVSDDGKSFVEGDEIQVVNMSRETNNSATFIYDGMGWSTEDVILWSTQGDNVFKAWHPADASFDSFTIPTNQSAGLGGSDWMTAQSTARPSDGGVSLRFSRHLTKVKVTIESWGDEYADSEKKVARLDLMSSSSVMSNDGNEIAGNSTPTPVITYILEEDRSMVAIIAPGEYSAGDEFMNVYINGNFSEPLKVYTAKQLILHPGMAYELKLIIGRDRIEISPDAIYVTDWDDEILDDQIVSEQAVVDLSAQGTANSYIVSSSGAYKFTPAKGNSDESVVSIASAVVLWESFGTDVTPNVGDLVKNVKYVDGKICFETPDTFKEGNALIAAKDADGTILWSWHIWLTDQPEEQVYYNDAGTMMDRNLGATSATPGDVGALGLLYQWGRKDPFLGSSSISEAIDAASTITWPSAVSSTASTGTIAYAIANPTSFITSVNNDWCYPYSSTDNTRWTTSLNRKSIYDPCPSGWRISDGGDDGVWSKALGSAVYFQDPSLYDETNKGMNLSGKLGSDAIIWYPASSYRDDEDGLIYDVGDYYYSWTSYNSDNRANYTFFDYRGVVNPSRVRAHSFGFSVRCAREVMTPSTPQAPEVVNLSEEGTANSYIVSQKGAYKFSTVKGNSSESVGAVASVEVLWETFGTDVTPNVGDLVKNVSYKNGEVTFQTADTFKEGNAVIAAKDASGTILWSWHIWLTDQPVGQVYFNDAGTMMDRNLGATSATPGGVGALGLLYQWGRKDPFLGSSSISSSVEAKSTITWPSVVESNSTNGTIEYASANPTTFITSDSNNYDWYYTGSSSTENTRWQSYKTIYDPCPAGWRVPDGGEDGIWSKALCSSSSFTDETLYDTTNQGMNFSSRFGDASTIWYPDSGYRDHADGSLYNVGYCGYCFSVSPRRNHAHGLYFSNGGNVYPSNYSNRAHGRSVRCVREGTTPSTPADPEAVDLSEDGTANSYIVSQKGAYKFSTVKGNSSESVGAVASAEVLWETFGTDVTPNVGDLVKNVSYKNGEVTFQTADTFKEGNAVIAAKDASGNILWSWHIWLTDEPQGQVYYNNAGTMMDRNLGATSATPGDVGALGLLYQWGRKDPFLGSSSISEGIKACSTTSWSSAVESDSSNGTLEYAIANPTTFISANNLNNDWYYTGTSLADDTRWTGSESTKTIYDPCPRGWRVPDGGDNGVWAKAVGSTSSSSGYQYQQSNEGINFSGVFGASSVIWYPTPGGLNYITGSLEHVGYSCRSWASSAYRLFLDSTGYLTPAGRSTRAYGYTVRCVSENPELEVPEEPSEPEPSQPSYSLHLKPSTYGWVKSSTVLNPDASLYDGVYESTNQGVNDTKSVMYIDINGYDEFTFYVRSYAESNYDYVQVSNLDTDISSLKMTTKGNQQSGTSLSSYTEVTFTNIGGGQHRITVVYVKDYSQHSADDKGYVLIPKNQGVNTPEAPSEPQDGDYVDEYGINHGQGIEIDGVVWAPVNCGYHATDYQYGKLYQWGRKYGQGYKGPLYDENGNESGTYSDASVPSIVSDPVSLSVGQSSSNSDKFYVFSSSPYDWVTPQDDTLWNSGTEDNPVKTEYDPCPKGWRVPTNAELNNLQSKYWSMTTNDGQEGCLFGGKVFFPAAGFRSYIGAYAYARGLSGIYWSSTPYDPGARNLDINTKGGYGVVMAGTFRVNGYSVRCVQE